MTRTEVLAELEELRRRLYGPDATAEDRERFAELQRRLDGSDGPAIEAQPAEEPPREGPPRGPRKRWIVVAGVAVAVLLAAVIALAQSRARSPVSSAADAPTVTATPVPSAPSGTGSPQRAYGSGSAVVALDTASAPADGTLIVVLSSSDPSPVGWRAERRLADGTWSTVFTSAPALRSGVAQPASASYRGAAPRRVVVQAATGTRWTLTVALLSSADSPLH